MGSAWQGLGSVGRGQGGNSHLSATVTVKLKCEMCIVRLQGFPTQYCAGDIQFVQIGTSDAKT